MTELEEKMKDIYNHTNTELTLCIKKTFNLLIICIMTAIILLFASNMAWLYVWNQYEYQVVELDSESGNANYIGESGDITNCESKSR